MTPHGVYRFDSILCTFIFVPHPPHLIPLTFHLRPNPLLLLGSVTQWKETDTLTNHNLENDDDNGDDAGDDLDKTQKVEVGDGGGADDSDGDGNDDH